MTSRRFAPIAAVITLAVAPACITETEAGAGAVHGMRTEGVILAGSLDAIWSRTEGVVAAMATAPVTSQGLPHSLRTEVGGAEVTAFAEPYDAQRTIVHLRCEDPATADRIRMRIMQP